MISKIKVINTNKYSILTILNLEVPVNTKPLINLYCYSTDLNRNNFYILA